MRIDNSDSNLRYRGFRDWLVYDWHRIFIFALIIGYFTYLNTTTEV
jgi:hypothetical protein